MLRAKAAAMLRVNQSQSLMALTRRGAQLGQNLFQKLELLLWHLKPAVEIDHSPGQIRLLSSMKHCAKEARTCTCL